MHGGSGTDKEGMESLGTVGDDVVGRVARGRGRWGERWGGLRGR